jgi:hypothetical protein
VLTSQIRTVWAGLAEASQLPSGATATARNQLVGSGRREVASQPGRHRGRTRLAAVLAA